jgi:hypothetical protein
MASWPLIGVTLGSLQSVIAPSPVQLTMMLCGTFVRTSERLTNGFDTKATPRRSRSAFSLLSRVGGSISNVW